MTLRPDLDVYSRPGTNQRAHVTIGRRIMRLACGRPVPKDLEAMAPRNLEHDPSVLCIGCRRALMGPGPWKDPNHWVRAPFWVSEKCYVGDPIEAWRLNALTWQRVAAVARGVRQTRAAVSTLLDALSDAETDPDKQHVWRALGDGYLHMWGLAVEAGWYPPAPQKDVGDAATEAWWIAWWDADD